MATKSTKTTKASTKTNTKTTRSAAARKTTTAKAPARKTTTAKAPARKTTTAKAPARKTTATRAASVAPVESRIPDGEYRPISMWGYFGWEIVYAIPLIGWIICVGQAFCANNRNLRNFARSQFCWLILWLISVCVLAGLGVFTSMLETLGWI